MNQNLYGRCGDTIYNISHIAQGEPRELFVKFHHHQWSWGQDFPDIAWSHGEAANFIYLSDLSYIFPGLLIGLDYGGLNGWLVAWYAVTEVHESFGYCVVMPFANLQYRFTSRTDPLPTYCRRFTAAPGSNNNHSPSPS